MNRYKCPVCDHDRFYVSPHVLQDWVVDGHGNWLETINECVEVLHRPDDEDLWTCEECRHETSGNLMREDSNG